MSRPTAVIFSMDEQFAPLGKGLVLSVIDQCDSNEFTLNLVDIGCSEETLKWMTRHGVKTKKFNQLEYYSKPFKGLKSYQDAELCRPCIPALFPEYDIYIWCDADTWVQNISSLRTYRDAVLTRSSNIAISPLIDTTYQFYYTDCTEFASYNHNWYSEAYDRDTADALSRKAILSAGVFALHANSPIWKAWGVEIESVFRRRYSSQVVQHLAEQTALNYLIYSHNEYTPLEAIHNYNCHIGCAVRRNGRVVLNNFPFREVGIIHLTLSGRKMKEYIESGLLYREGKYLSADELSKLATVAHY